jgi:hypothetical protein
MCEEDRLHRTLSSLATSAGQPSPAVRSRVKNLCGWCQEFELPDSRRERVSPTGSGSKTATHAGGRSLDRCAFTATRIDVGGGERIGDSGEQTPAIPLFAGMHG